MQCLDNLLLNTDSYKASHWLQYPPGTDATFFYVESRGGTYDRNNDGRIDSQWDRNRNGVPYRYERRGYAPVYAGGYRDGRDYYYRDGRRDGYHRDRDRDGVPPRHRVVGLEQLLEGAPQQIGRHRDVPHGAELVGARHAAQPTASDVRRSHHRPTNGSTSGT